MWNTEKQKQLEQLQQLEHDEALTNAEKQIFEQLLLDLEQEEWRILNPALERLNEEQRQLRQQLGQIQTKNAILTALAARQENLVQRARMHLETLRLEHTELKSERKKVLDKLAA